MNRATIAITFDQYILDRLDELISRHIYPNRSRAIQDAVEEKLHLLERSHLTQECAKLDPNEEKALAEEGFSEELNQWPKY
ncbi:CopG family transcriptional regulator [Candidatus Thiomargarita nelsonii]|uniref:CopG family transcriptional regulator n=1 Tax=Candidatus Thiomargarita nelsonii TaxID=1003181 RepID=A0A4E0RAX6_9GAMM|nr:CopG family transcriptional regulator [Candidatus Thiomargarita nelsonii]